MNNSRIAFVLPSLEAGGAEKSIAQLANCLAHKYRVDLLTVRRKGLLINILGPDVNLHSLHGRILFPIILFIYIWRTKPAVIISTLWDLNIVLCLLKPFLPDSTKLILREAINPEQDMNKRRFSKALKKLYKFAYPKADSIVALSISMKNNLSRFLDLPSNKFEVIYNAVYENCRLTIHKQPEITQEEVIFTSLGRLTYQKGYDLLIKAFNPIHTKYPKTRLNIYGEGNDKKSLLELIRKHDLDQVVKIHDYTPDIRKIFSQTDVYVLSSRYEGLSNAMLEALYCGIPVLAISTHTSAEEIIQEGLNGFLIPGQGITDISLGLERAILEHKNLNRTAIAIDSRKKFDSSRNIQQYENLIQSMQRHRE